MIEEPRVERWLAAKPPSSRLEKLIVFIGCFAISPPAWVVAAWLYGWLRGWN